MGRRPGSPPEEDRLISTDIPIHYAEDLTAQAVRIDLGSDQLLALSPHCHKGSGYGVAVDVYAAVMVLICRKCRKPCAAFRIAKKLKAS